MKKLSLIIPILILVSFSPLLGDNVNGQLEEINGKDVLTIWGTHTERGYANGYLMGEQILEVFNDYLLENVFMSIGSLYEMARSEFITDFDVEQKYYDETEAIISGIEDSGVSIYNDILGRKVDEIDILISNSILEIAIIGNLSDKIFNCSSLSSWGQSTQQDPTLNGESIITRNLDWTPHQTLLDNQVLIVNKPSEADEQNWISFTFAGLIGCLSSINEEGVGSFLDVGNNSSHPNPGPFHPIFFAVRNGIESADYNADGNCNAGDVAQAVEDKTLLSDNIIHVVNKNNRDTTALVIECNNANGVAIRTMADNTMISGDNLAATNHFRKLYDPVYCYRYENIADSLESSTQISIDRSWELLGGAAGVITNIQTIQFIPFNGDIKWATSPSLGAPAYQQTPSNFNAADLFASYSVDDQPSPQSFHLSAYPNPTSNYINIQYNNLDYKRCKINVYDVKGRLVQTKAFEPDCKNGNLILETDDYPIGVYFYKLNRQDSPVKKFSIIK